MNTVVKIARKESDSVSQIIHVKTKVPACTTLTLPTTLASVSKALKDVTVLTISMNANGYQTCVTLKIGEQHAGTP